MIELPKTPPFDLSGKTALVTGASSGIGLACATAFAEADAKVYLAARRKSELDKVGEAFRARGWQAESLVMDVANVEETAKAVEQYGPFDILLNSAGSARNKPAFETSSADYDAVMNLNVKGAFFLTAAVAKGLVKAGKSGSLINISSQMGHVGGVDRGVYAASKHAVEGFTKSLAIEFGGHNIRVNTLCPTFIRTPLTAPTFDNPERVAWIKSKIKLGRVGEVEDIMGAAVYLASDASSLVTGTCIKIDGGWTAG